MVRCLPSFCLSEWGIEIGQQKRSADVCWKAWQKEGPTMSSISLLARMWTSLKPTMARKAWNRGIWTREQWIFGGVRWKWLLFWAINFRETISSKNINPFQRSSALLRLVTSFITFFFKSHLAIHMQSLYQRSLNILYAGRHAFSLTLF